MNITTVSRTGKTRVGLPRAMGYYYLYPFIRTLIQELGAELVLSPPTTGRILEGMDACPTDEPCLAVKLHFSHADALARREDIDLLLLPIIARVDGAHCCPKFIGIGDMIRHGLRLPESRVLTPVVDYSSDDRSLLRALRPLAARLGVPDRAALAAAIRRARAAQEEYRQLCISRRLTTPEAYQLLEGKPLAATTPPPADGPVTAVIGHPYITYEPVSQGMIARLRAYGPVLTAEMVPPEQTAGAMATVHEGERMWPFEAMLLGAALHLLRARQVDRMILVGSFECGPESIIECYVEEEARRQGIPLMVLSLDEHSGEAGLVTRLEAFMDTDKVTEPPAPEPAIPALRPREEVVLGLPSMGHLDLVVRRLVESFGLRTVPTPRTTRQCVELGRELAPEFVCFPFTATLGQMRYMLDHGANTLLMVGGKGNCRLGWYAQVQERLLRGMGYTFDMLEVDTPFPLGRQWGKFHGMIRRLAGDASWWTIGRALYHAHRTLAAMDRAERIIHRLRAFERDQGTADRLLDRHIRALAKAEDQAVLARLEREFDEAVAAVEVEETDPLRVRVTGEIWVVLEQSATREVERWLGARTRPRIWVDRELSTSSWFDSHVLHLGPAARREEEILHAAHPWLAHKVGGHGQETVGRVALAPGEGIDGVLHVFPFTCMPEIIAQNIIVRMAEEMDVPVLTYIVSEQTGEAGMETRLESFLDLLEERRLARQDHSGLASMPVG